MEYRDNCFEDYGSYGYEDEQDWSAEDTADYWSDPLLDPMYDE